MSTPTIAPGLLCMNFLIKRLRHAENALKVDLVLKLHTDGSGRIQDNATDKDLFIFDSLADLSEWFDQNRDKLRQPTKTTQRGRFFISNPCLGGFHSQCEDACHCRCHQPSEGIGA